MDKLIHKTYSIEVLREADAKALFESAKKIYQCNLKGKAINDNRVLFAKISTINPDRSNDVVRPDGVILDNYLNNPVVAAFHKYDQPAIGRTIQIGITEDAILAKMEFAPEGVNDKADMLFQLYKDGMMNAWSIGFISKESNPRPEGGFEFLKWELLEYSAVLVPDNPEALSLIKSKGLDPDQILKDQEEAVKQEDNDSPKTQETKEEDQKTPQNEELKSEKEVQDAVIEEKDGEFTFKFLFKDGTSIEAPATKELVESLKEQLGRKEFIKEKINQPKSEENQDPQPQSEEENKELLDLLNLMKKHVKKADKENGLALQAFKKIIALANNNTENNEKGGEKIGS